MTVDIIIHGVPNGQDMWGVNDDTHYFSTFYVQKDEKEILTIETRKVSGKSYCYYNYLKYNGVIASDERAGSYLGITFRFDAYYKDVLNVYHLCEIVYNNLLDTILVKNGDNVKFKIAKFNDADRELNEIKKKTINLINLSATAKDFTSISDSFFKNEGSVIKAFLLDCTSDNVMQALVKYGKVEISKYQPSINEAKKIKNVEERYSATIAQKDKVIHNTSKQNEDLKKELSRLQNELESQKGEIKKLNTLVSEKEEIIKKNADAIKEIDTQKKKHQELKNSIQEKEREIKRLESELHKYKDNRNISDLVKEIKEPLNKLATLAGRQLTEIPNNNSSYTNEDIGTTNSECKKYYEKSFWTLPIWQIIKVGLLLFILCSSIYCVCKLHSFKNNKVKTEQTVNTTFIKDTENVLVENVNDNDTSNIKK